MTRKSQAVKALPISLFALVLSGCGFNNPQSSPEVVYSSGATDAKQLQVPPDLTSISNGEQFILPGNEPGSLTRNRLLPTFAGAQYVRRGNQNWLELNQSAETIWPLVLEFIRKQKMAVERTEPTTGLVVTQWRSDDGKSGGLLKNLISSDDQVSRYMFRLERNGTGTRVFARSMMLNADDVDDTQNDQWPASSHDPEQVSQLLSSLLVFMGAEEQKAQGILSEPQASAVLDDAVLQTTASGSQLVVNKGFLPSFKEVQRAVEQLEYKVLTTDASVGSMEVSTGADAPAILVSMTPVHVSAVRVLLSQVGGESLEKDLELSILSAIRQQII